MGHANGQMASEPLLAKRDTLGHDKVNLILLHRLNELQSIYIIDKRNRFSFVNDIDNNSPDLTTVISKSVVI
jgi:hypothetical protein